MEWSQQIDGYCERIDPSYWAEPVNALTNAAFLIAAFVMWRRCRGARLPLAHLLIVILAAIGVGSYLFHTHATVWAAFADVTPIAAFILVYIYASNRDYWGLDPWPALGLTTLFIPYVAITVPIFQRLPFLEVSAGYWPVPLLIGIYALLLRKRLPQVARGLGIGVAILMASLLARTLDMQICGALPLGSHFLWHLLNGLMLGWMIEVYRRHKLGPGASL